MPYVFIIRWAGRRIVREPRVCKSGVGGGMHDESNGWRDACSSLRTAASPFSLRLLILQDALRTM